MIGVASLPHNAAVEVEPVAVARQAQEGQESNRKQVAIVPGVMERLHHK